MANFLGKGRIAKATLGEIDEALARLDSSTGRMKREEVLRQRDEAQAWLDERAEYRLSLQKRQIELLKSSLQQTKN